MALKDWKQIRKGYRDRIQFVNEKKLKYLDIFTDSIWFSNEWKVNVMIIKNRQMNNIISEFFKTKSQALKFAKAYMRTH